MASPTPSLESRANSLGSLASLSPLTVSGSSPPASDSAICGVDGCDLCLDAPLGKPGDPACPRCRLGAAPPGITSLNGTSSSTTSLIAAVTGLSVSSKGPTGGCSSGSSASSTSSVGSSSTSSSSGSLASSASGTGSASGLLTAASSNSNLLAGVLGPLVGSALSDGSPPGSCLGGSLSVLAGPHNGVRCTGCKSTESDAVARCYDCANYLCPNCVMAHQFMHCFEGHRVLNLGNGTSAASPSLAAGSGAPVNGNGNPAGPGSASPSAAEAGSKLGPGQQADSGLASNGQQQQQQSQQQQSQQQQSQQQQQQQQQQQSNGTGSPNGQLTPNGSADGAASGQGKAQNGNGAPSGGIHNLMSNSFLVNGASQAAPAQSSNGEKPVYCRAHKSEQLKFYCRNCSMAVCKECLQNEHSGPSHEAAHINDMIPYLMESINRAILDCRAKASEIRAIMKTAEHGSARLQVQYHKAQNEINDTFQFYRSMLEERKQELLKELESIFSAKQISLSVCTQKSNDMVDKIQQTCDFVERVSKCSNAIDSLMVKKLLDGKLQMILSYSADANALSADLEFVSNYQAIQVGVRNTFGYVRSSGSTESNAGGPSKQPPIARPTASLGQQMSVGPGSNSSSANSGPGSAASLGGLLLDRPFTSGLIPASGSNCPSSSPSPFENSGSVITGRFASANSLGPFSTTISELSLNGMNPYERWSNGGSEPYPGVSVGGNEHGFPMPAVTATAAGAPGDSVLDLTSKLMPTAAIFPLKSQIKRQKMIYHCKFGEFGVMEGQFTEPSGVAVNAQNDIIVADTNNHRIQIFDKEGRFKFQFGECGKRDGQLLYPNRVAVVRTSGDIIVTERSPTHQIQIYNQYGQFVRKFGANILQHPRGVTVDSKGRIVVVECKVMRVIIFDQAGNVLQKFGCSKHLEFPNGVVVNDKQEIFISDNRAHCVKVFNYEGSYIRQIGGEGITNYPIGVGINSAGEILIADNHNNFNLTIFTQDGNLVSALESKVKHAQCFDVALMDDGSVVLASKDYRLYIYRYVQVPPIGI